MKKGNLVIWGYFTENLGDDLMLKAFLNSVKGKYKKIYINSFKQYKPLYSGFGVKVVLQNALVFRVFNKFFCLINRPELYYRFTLKKDTDFVMLGGSLFIEAQGAENARRFKNLEYAVNHAKKSYVIGSNFGPYYDDNFLYRYKSLFKKCKDICFRDKYSYGLFCDMPNVRYAPDIILSGVWGEKPEIAEKTYGAVVISVINLENRANLKDKTGEYEKFLADIAVHHIKQGDHVVLAAFCEREGDAEACWRIKELCGDFEPQIAVYKGLDFLKLLSDAKKIYGSRFHSIILAMYYGIPCVPFIYSDKTLNALTAYCSSFQAIDITKLPEYSFEDIAKPCGPLAILPNVKNDAAQQFEGID